MQPRISDALELLTAQHDEIELLLSAIAATASPAHRSKLITDLADQVTIHLAVEQELFYPAVSDLIGSDVHAELLAEHAEVKRVLADLLWRDHDDERWGHTLTRLRELLSVHAAWQERHLFETIAEKRTPAELAQVGGDITDWLDGLVVAAA
jgi:hypothetical protein